MVLPLVMMMMMMLCASLALPLMGRVLSLLCLLRTQGAISPRDLYLVCKQESKSGDAQFGIGWTTAVVGATDEAIR